MIDDKINKSLREMEKELQNLNSACHQVDKTVAAYAGLSESVASYVSSLKRISEEVQTLVKVVKQDYSDRTGKFQEQQREIQNQAISTLKSVEQAASTVIESVENIVSALQKKLNFCIGLNILTIIIVLVLHFFL